MANAKQYTDLQTTETLNDTDLMAVSQSGATELKTTTVGAVASRAAEIVSTDQVQEIVADLGLGKQILAQTLQDKGVDTTASDTLSQMATKLAAVDVVGAKEYLRGKVAITSSGYSENLPIACQCGIKNNKGLALTAGKIALIQIADDGTVEELATTTDEDIIVSNATYKSIWTNAAGTVAVYFNPKSTSASQALVFDIDLAAPSITLRGKIENLIAYSTTSALDFYYISEDGTKAVIFQQNTSDVASINWLNLTDLTAETTTQTLTVRLGYGAFSGFAYDIGEQTLMFMVADNYQADAYPITLDFSSKLISFGTAMVFSGNIPKYTHKGGLAILPAEGLLFKTTYQYDSNLAATDILLQAFSLSTNQVLDEIKLKNISLNLDSTTYMRDYNRTPMPFVAGVSQNIVKITGSYLTGWEFNTVTNKFNTENVASILDDIYMRNASLWRINSNPDSYYLYYPTMYLENTVANKVTFAPGTTGSALNIAGGGRLFTLSLSKEICFGGVYTRNGSTVVHQLSPWDDDAYEAGAYDIENKKVLLDLPEANQ
ncbi:hypothetical protein [Candidatus Avelusimicrobium alvi]|uniref:hypothetical protein n=1 Tax=Candidatus Avelusimicrobium alvi TaxID=3416221 RepID=UPI003D147E6A